MCRAVWAIVVASSDEACARLRRAAGIDVQVVAAATSLTDALDEAERTRADVFVVDAAVPDAARIAELLRERAPDAAVVWVGESAPSAAHHAVGGDAIQDTLPGAITKALLARKR